MARRQKRERTRINNPKPLGPKNKSITVHNSHLIIRTSHYTGASGMVYSDHGFADPLHNLIFRLNRWTGESFNGVCNA